MDSNEKYQQQFKNLKTNQLLDNQIAINFNNINRGKDIE